MPHSKLLGPGRIRLRVGLGGLALLISGWLTAPQSRSVSGSGPQSAEAQASTPLLTAELNRRESLRAFERIQELGIRVLAHSVSMASPVSARATTPDVGSVSSDAARVARSLGVVISGTGRILTHASVLQGQSTAALITATGLAVTASVVAFDTASNAVLLQAPNSSDLPGAPLAPALPDAGALVIASARSGDTDIIAPVFAASVQRGGFRVTGAANLPVGTPLYNADGELVAVVAPGGEAIPATSVVLRLRALLANGRGLAPALGVATQQLAPTMAEWFGRTGLVVADVRADGPAAQAGVRPGDVLLEVTGRSVSAAADLAQAMSGIAPGAPIPLTVRRNGNAVEMTVTAGSLYELTWRPREEARESTAGVPLRNVLPSDQLVRHGLDGSALLLSLNLQPARSVPDARRTLARARTGVLLHVDDGRERRFVVLEEPQP